MSLTIAEGRALATAIKRYARVYQCGTQRRNCGQFVFAINLALSGKLGKLHTMQAEKAWPDSALSHEVLPAQPQPERKVMAWDLWLGPAHWRRYNAKYYSRRFWSRHADFSGGSITEWGSHTVDLCQWANHADNTSPVEYQPINESGDVEARYANGVKLVIRKGLRFGSCPVRIEGDEGWVEVGDSGRVETHPASLRGERQFGGGYPADDHVRQFLDCVKTRRQPASHVEASHRSITACHAANLSVALDRRLKWDPARERFIDDDQANRLISRAMRVPWRL
jgi:predicted dehydrogenase